MAYKQTTFTCTTDVFGNATTDSALSIPFSAVRPVYLDFVSIDESAAINRVQDIFVYQLENDDNLAEQEGAQLFNALFPDPLPNILYPRISTVDADGVANAIEGDRILIRTKRVRVTVRPTVTLVGDVFTVVLGYETAGDYRF